jgi:hypothetical protein
MSPLSLSHASTWLPSPPLQVVSFVHEDTGLPAEDPIPSEEPTASPPMDLTDDDLLTSELWATGGQQEEEEEGRKEGKGAEEEGEEEEEAELTWGDMKAF